MPEMSSNRRAQNSCAFSHCGALEQVEATTADISLLLWRCCTHSKWKTRLKRDACKEASIGWWWTTTVMAESGAVSMMRGKVQKFCTSHTAD